MPRHRARRRRVRASTVLGLLVVGFVGVMAAPWPASAPTPPAPVVVPAVAPPSPTTPAPDPRATCPPGETVRGVVEYPAGRLEWLCVQVTAPSSRR